MQVFTTAFFQVVIIGAYKTYKRQQFVVAVACDLHAPVPCKRIYDVIGHTSPASDYFLMLIFMLNNIAEYHR